MELYVCSSYMAWTGTFTFTFTNVKLECYHDVFSWELKKKNLFEIFLHHHHHHLHSGSHETGQLVYLFGIIRPESLIHVVCNLLTFAEACPFTFSRNVESSWYCISNFFSYIFSVFNSLNTSSSLLCSLQVYFVVRLTNVILAAVIVDYFCNLNIAVVTG